MSTDNKTDLSTKKPIISSDSYTDPSGNSYKKCNMSINEDEYYDATGKDAVAALGGIVSIPFILSSLITSACFMSVFMAISVSIYNTSEQKMTGGMIFAVICCLLCLSVFISNIVNYIKAKNNINSIKSNPTARPCYSDKQQKLIN